MTEFDWHEEPARAGLPVRQVHGWLADETGRFLLPDASGPASFPRQGL